MYEEFLENVIMLKFLEFYEWMNFVDVLVIRNFLDGEIIIV